MGGEVGAQRELEYQQAVVEALADAASVREGTPALLESLCRRVGWRAGELWIVDPRTNVLGRSGSWPAARAASTRRARGGRALTGADGAAIARSVWSSGEAEWAIDRSPRRPWSTPWRSVFAFPVLTGSRAVGALVLLDPRLKARDDAFARRMSRLGLHIGAWIQCKGVEEALRAREEEYRQLSGRLLRLQDEERRRIARDLHDSTAQRLTALIMNLDVVRRAARHLDHRSRRALSEGRALADETLKEIRTLSYVLHPPLLDETGLASAVRWYVTGFSERSGVHVELDLAELGRVPVRIEQALYRVVQESLTNIHRHSGSRFASISLARTGAFVTLVVRDRGGGLRDATRSTGSGTPRTLGVGIQSMRERVYQLGGTFDMESSRAGTTVRVRVALKRAAQSAGQNPDRRRS